MKNIANCLTTYERLQLADDIDYILEYLVRKEASPDIARRLYQIEQELTSLLNKFWNAKSKKAAEMVIKALKIYGKKLTALHAEVIANKLEEPMSHELVKVVRDRKLIDHVMYAYDMVGKQTAKELQLPYALTFVDKQAKEWLAKDMTYWIGQYYNNHIKEAVTSAVVEYAIEQGQGPWATGQRIKDILAGTYEIPPKFMPKAYIRAEAYWQGLANNAITRAAVFGRIEPMVAADVETYEIINANDTRVCPLCRFMNGKRFSMQHAVEMRNKFLSAENPEDIKTIHPWRTLKEVKEWDDAKLAANGMSLPDYHFHCRCTIIATTFREYDKPVEVVAEPTRPRSEVPNSLKGLEYKGSGAYLGGAGKKYIYEDSKGQRYIYKPAEAKFGGGEEPFRAYVQEGASRLAAKLYEPDQFIEVKAIKDMEGRIGTLQKFIQDVEGDLKKISWDTLTKDDWRRIQEEHVLDWVIANFDAHPGNFIKLKDGRILATDKEQAFRYLDDIGSQKMSYNYHPNAKYGEVEPIYNTIYRAFAKGEIDLDLQAVLPTLKRLEAISDNEYRKIFRPYAEALKGKGAEAEKLLDAIVARKNTVRESYREFFTQLLKERNPGFKGVFKFLDEITEAEAKAMPLAAQRMSKAELSKLTKKTLLEMGKAKKIPYVHHMNKNEIIQALADPENAVDIVLKVKERLNASQQKRLGPKPREAAKPTGVDIFDDFDIIPKVPFGVAIKKDAKVLEGQQITARRIQIDGEIGYHIYFKIPEFYHKDIIEAIQALGGTEGYFELYRGIVDRKAGIYRTRTEHAVERKNALVLNYDGIKVAFYPRNYLKAYKGYFEITVFEPDGKKAASKVKELLGKLKLNKILDDPTADDDRLHRLSVLAWQHAPQDELRLKLQDRTVEKMEQLLRRKGIDPKMADNLVEKEVWPGYKTYVNTGIVKEYKKAGAVNLWTGVGRDAETVAKIISPDSPGLMSTIQRKLNGIFGTGASEGGDEESGGADSVFTRLVTRKNKGKYLYRHHYKGGGYRLIFDISVLERTDWYAYNKDKFGEVGTLTYERRKSAIDHIKEVDHAYNKGNEVMFRRGIGKEYIKEIHCDTESEKNSLIYQLKKIGIDTFNGKPIEEIIKVKEEI